MRAAFACELHRLTSRRSTWVILLVGVVLSLPVSWGYSIVATNVAIEEGGSTAVGTAVFLVSRGSMIGVFAGLLGACATGSEFRRRTLDTTLLLTPRRSVVFVAKLQALSLVSVAAAVISMGACLLVGAMSSSGRLLDGLSGQNVLTLLSLHIVFVVGCVVVGASVTFLLRSQLAALGVMLAYPLAVEPVLRGAGTVVGPSWAAELVPLLPWTAGGAMHSLGSGPPGPLSVVSSASPATSAAAFLAVMLLIATGAAWSFSRRELTRRV